MKKVILIFILAVSWVVAPHVLAAGDSSGFTALAPILGLTNIAPTSVVNSATLANFFNNLYKYLIGLSAMIAIIEIIWGGLEIATNQDNVSKIMDSKGKIYNAILGLILVLAPVIVFSIINPSILNLSLNLPKLDTAPPAKIVPTTTTKDISTSYADKGSTLITCAGNDCTSDVYTCTHKPVSNGISYETIVCVNSNDVIDSASKVTADAKSSCPPPEIKKMTCTVRR